MTDLSAIRKVKQAPGGTGPGTDARKRPSKASHGLLAALHFTAGLL
jgi:hypothetical protein